MDIQIRKFEPLTIEVSERRILGFTTIALPADVHLMWTNELRESTLVNALAFIAENTELLTDLDEAFTDSDAGQTQGAFRLPPLPDKLQPLTKEGV